MKKTLIALAVVASAAVSGSAMATSWGEGNIGGTVDLGGTLVPVEKVTPWEAKIGDAVKDLDGSFQKGQKIIDININKAIPLLGVRTKVHEPFHGQEGISPQISYGDAINVDAFKVGSVPLTLEVKNGRGTKIGKALTLMNAAALVSYSDSSGSIKNSLYASDSGSGFFGGVGKSAAAIASYPVKVAKSIFPEVLENFDDQRVQGDPTPGQTKFALTKGSYSGFYVSGIPSNQIIKIILDQEVDADSTIQWNASLPITIAYV